MERIASKEVVLAGTGNESRRFVMRAFACGDEQGMMECVREEYGDSYFKRDFYDEAKIRENAFGGHYRFFVAETDGEIAGMEIFALFGGDEDYIEPASQIIRKKYRGYGLASELVHYTLPLAEQMRPCSLFVHAVTFHKATQSVCEDYGMVPVGFRLGSFLASLMHNSYNTGLCDKYSEGILIKPVAKKDAGEIYLPGELADYGRKIYDRLGVKYHILTPDEAVYQGKFDGIAREPDEDADVEINTDRLQRSVRVKVVGSGRNLAAIMRELISGFGGEENWTIQVMLNIDSPAVYYEYEELKKVEFFFAGLKPLCGVHERMYMQWTGETRLNMENYELTDSFDELRQDIDKYYRNRKG